MYRPWSTSSSYLQLRGKNEGCQTLNGDKLYPTQFKLEIYRGGGGKPCLSPAVPFVGNSEEVVITKSQVEKSLSSESIRSKFFSEIGRPVFCELPWKLKTKLSNSLNSATHNLIYTPHTLPRAHFFTSNTPESL